MFAKTYASLTLVATIMNHVFASVCKKGNKSALGKYVGLWCIINSATSKC